MALSTYISHLHSSSTPRVFYTYFYNHAHRLRLEKLLCLGPTTAKNPPMAISVARRQALTFGAFARFDPEKRGWLGPGLKTLKPRSFFRAVKAGARLSLLRGAAGGDFLGASILLQLQRAAPRLSPPVRCHSHSPVVGLLLHRRAAT